MAIKDLLPKRTVDFLGPKPPLPKRYRRITSFHDPEGHWQVDAEFPDERKVPGQAVSAIVTVFPGMMPRDWKIVQREVSKLLSQPQRTKGKPGLSSEKRGLLERAIVTVGPPNRNQTQAQNVSAILEHMKSHGQPVSQSTVLKRYRQWLDANQYPKKRYIPDRDLKF